MEAPFMAKRRISRRQFLEGTGTVLTVAAAAPALSGQSPAAAPAAPRTTISVTLNRAQRRLDVEDRWTLAEALRDHTGLTGTQIGCPPGQCRAGTLPADGRSR